MRLREGDVDFSLDSGGLDHPTSGRFRAADRLRRLLDRAIAERASVCRRSESEVRIVMLELYMIE